MNARTQTLAADLESHLLDQQLASQPKLRALGLFQGSLMQWVFDRAKQSISEKIDTPAERQAIGEAALAVFDKWDMPYIDGLAESAVKSMIRPQLILAIDAILSGTVNLLA